MFDTKGWTNTEIRRYIDNKLTNKTFEQIISGLRILGISESRLNIFLREHVYSSLVIEKNPLWFRFVAENISTDDLIGCLSSKNFIALRVFLAEAKTLKNAFMYTKDEQTFRIEKFKILLEKANQLITTFMIKNKTNIDLADLEYEQALGNGGNCTC